jgi:GNAT superfamily N-acetyltransferase
MAEWAIERLERGHDRSHFNCGYASLNEWLQLRAGQFDRRDLARTFVAVRPGEQFVLGYYALTNHRVIYDALPPTESKGLPKIDVPVVLLGRLAVDVSVQGRGLGSLLLVDALRRILEVAHEVGVRAVEVDAIDDNARRFYERFGFQSLLDDPRHLFLPLQTVRRLKFS